MSTLLQQVAKPQNYPTVKQHMGPCRSCLVSCVSRTGYCWKCWIASNRPPILEERFIIDGEICRKIPLTRGKYSLVEESLYDEAMQWNWAAWKCPVTGNFYAIRKLPRKEYGNRSIALHVYIAKPEQGFHVDHRNHDTLDNRRSNLRIATPSQNNMNRLKQSNNTSGYPGISWYKAGNKWEAYIRINGKKRRLGYFPKDQYELAVAARKEAETKIFGEWACKH